MAFGICTNDLVLMQLSPRNLTNWLKPCGVRALFLSPQLGSNMAYTVIDDINAVNGDQYHPLIVNSTIVKYLNKVGLTDTEYTQQYAPTPSSEASVYAAAMNNTPSKIFNCSWGTTGGTAVAGTEYWWQNDAYTTLENAYVKGDTFVFSVGNDSLASQHRVSSTSSGPFNLTAAALDSTLTKLASYSNASPEMVTAVLGGDGSYTLLGGGTVSETGTSFAAPRLTALVDALQIRAGNTLSNQDIVNIVSSYGAGTSLQVEGNSSAPTYIYNVINDSAFQSMVFAGFKHGQLTMQEKVEGAYALILDRVADFNGLTFYTNMANTQGIDAVYSALYNSSEHANVTPNHTFSQVTLQEKVAALYDDVLNRIGDDAGAAYWMNYAISHEPTPTNTQVVITGTKIDWHQLDQAFCNAAGVAAPYWLA
jgi:hypothetical protein